MYMGRYTQDANKLARALLRHSVVYKGMVNLQSHVR